LPTQAGQQPWHWSGEFWAMTVPFSSVANAVNSPPPCSTPRSGALWTAIDHELVDRAYWVPTVNAGVAELVSARLGNYQYHPVWGFMAAQAWVR
jgi:hypothetical protein